MSIINCLIPATGRAPGVKLLDLSVIFSPPKKTNQNENNY